MKDRGAILGYAGTTAPRAQETLDVMLAEIHKLQQGITQDELDRARIGMKSGIVMQGESTSARASAIPPPTSMSVAEPAHSTSWLNTSIPSPSKRSTPSSKTTRPGR